MTLTSTRRRRSLAVLARAGVVLAGACSTDDDAGGEGAATTADAAAEGLAVGVAEVAAPGRPATGVRDEVSGVALETTSTYPGWVTGGDVAVRVTVPADVDASPELAVDGEPRPGALVLAAPTDADAAFVGVVDDLPEGTSTLTATVGDVVLDLEVTDHPVTGPLFSGPHQEPFACTVERVGLGTPLDDDCTVEPVTSWRYRTEAGEWAALAEGDPVPDDAARASVGGVEVPFVVRTEQGTINRGIYEVHHLDPSVGAEPASTPGEPAAGWNGRLVYRFGGGCGTTYGQGSNLAEALDPALLEQGYAIAANTLTTFQTACNDVLSAETALMVKERVAETLGVPELTIGDGGSGGAIQQLLIAQNYPGILDGITPSLPFPDAITIAAGITDCGLLLDWYATSEAAAGLTDEQQAAVNGHAVPGTCRQWSSIFLQGIDPTRGCALPPEQVYDPETNPGGARCTLQDSSVNLLGRDPETGFALRPLDNVGVQYGLAALLEGTIDVEQFLALNEEVGGYDIDGRIVEDRHEAPPAALAAAYGKGRVLSGAGLDASQTPVLATTTYLDDRGDIHDRFRIYSVRARMQDVGADPTLLAISSKPGRGSTIEALTGSLDAGGSAVVAIDRLLSLPPGERAVLTDTCTLPDGSESPTTDPNQGACAEAYPLHGDPRTAAGAPLANDVLKCTTRAPERADYGEVAFTDDQWQRLLAAFPDGVCDWTVPGVGQVALEGTWLEY